MNIVIVSVLVFSTVGKQYFDTASVFWGTAYVLFLAANQVFLKRFVEQVELTTADRVFWMNLLSCPVVLVGILLTEEHSSVVSTVMAVNGPLILGCILGFGMSHSAWSLRQQTSALTFTQTGIVCKLISMALNAIYFTHLDFRSMLLVSLGIVSATFYEQSPNSQDEAPTVLSTPTPEKLTPLVLLIAILIIGFGLRADEAIVFPTEDADQENTSFSQFPTPGVNLPDTMVKEKPLPDQTILRGLWTLNLKHYLDLDTKQSEHPDSLFFSMIDTDPSSPYYNSFYRWSWDLNWYRLGFMRFNKSDFTVVKDFKQTVISGQDPRLFVCDGKFYIVDNLLGSVSLVHLPFPNQENPDFSAKYYRLFLPGNNFAFFCYGSKIYFVDNMEPLRISIISELSPVPRVEIVYDALKSDDQDETNTFEGSTLRGGTPGIHVNGTPYVFGFGTQALFLESRGIFINRPFFWLLNLDTFRIWFRYYTSLVVHPTSRHNIVVPTCILLHNGDYFIVSAETIFPWVGKQDYNTTIYEIEGLSSFVTLLSEGKVSDPSMTNKFFP
eukprot:TRINITY_DN15849_c0_g1_i1.p1 TRINITY_DN15849_c0_g1~~TRINITY_DN15849_c0_g1_i1.p1  ORF type:complete len:553 (-),score=48.30 TRINITY_DN15849_c0_g1_i1:94-1752(-)